MTIPSTCRCGLVLFSLDQLADVVPLPGRSYLRAPCAHCDRPCKDGNRCQLCKRMGEK
jgi:hypothetical protein